MSSYIVTVKRKASPDPVVPLQLVSRRAVATLDEARKAAYRAVADSNAHALDATAAHAAHNLPESGGTIALPDGRVIEVEPTTWLMLARAAGVIYAAHPDRQENPPAHVQAEIIAAYNAAQGGGTDG